MVATKFLHLFAGKKWGCVSICEPQAVAGGHGGVSIPFSVEIPEDELGSGTVKQSPDCASI